MEILNASVAKAKTYVDQSQLSIIVDHIKTAMGNGELSIAITEEISEAVVKKIIENGYEVTVTTWDADPIFLTEISWKNA